MFAKKITSIILTVAMGFTFVAAYPLNNIQTNSVWADVVAVQNGPEQFVTRLYSVCMDRQPDSVGLEYWTSQLRSGAKSGGAVANGFLFSQEFLNHNYNNSTFVTYLYRVFFDREPDETGLNHWTRQLTNGKSREFVINGFINSVEWANLCLTYGITSGGTANPTITVTPGSVAPSSDSSSAPVSTLAVPVPTPAPVSTEVNVDAIRNFVVSLYNGCLGRYPDDTGLEYWTNKIASGEVTGKRAAEGFFYSREFLISLPTLTAEEVITRYYLVFLGRYPDADGMNYWRDVLINGGSADELFAGFADSQEFSDICQANGVPAGPHINVRNVQPYWAPYSVGLNLMQESRHVGIDNGAVINSIIEQCNYWVGLEESGSPDAPHYYFGGKTLDFGSGIDCSGFVTAIYKRALGTQTMTNGSVYNPAIYTSSQVNRGYWGAGLDRSAPSDEGVYYINGRGNQPVFTDCYGISTSYAMNTYQWHYYLEGLHPSPNSSLTWRIGDYNHEQAAQMLDLRGFHPGDIVLWYTTSVDGVHSDHIGIYAGNGNVWHCTSYLTDGIQLTSITYMGSYEGTTLQYCRIYHMS